MKDGSDAIADWPLLNALLNAACGASWVSFHHGGGVGIGRSIHAGQVVVADGTEPPRAGRARAHERPRHGRDPPRRRGLRRGEGGRGRARSAHPDDGDVVLVEHIGELVTNDPSWGGTLGVVRDAAVAIDGDRVTWVGEQRDVPGASRVRGSTRGGRPRYRGSSTATRTSFSPATGPPSSTPGCGGSATPPGDPDDGRCDPGCGDEELRANARRFREESLRTGTTHVEVKSGYGLDVDNEARCSPSPRSSPTT